MPKMIPHENDQIVGSIRQLTESEDIDLKAENEGLRDKVKEYALIAWVSAIFLHEGAANHTGDFEDCQVPVCVIARKMRDDVDIKAAVCFAEKEKAWLGAITDLKAENARLREIVEDGLLLIDSGDGYEIYRKKNDLPFDPDESYYEYVGRLREHWSNRAAEAVKGEKA